MIKAANILLILALFTHTACAEEPVSPVSGLFSKATNSDSNVIQSGGETTSLELPAITFKGSTGAGGCTVHLSKIEKVYDGEVYADFILKIKTRLHGRQTKDSVLSFIKYTTKEVVVGFKNGEKLTKTEYTFYPMSSDQPGTTTALVSSILKNKKTLDYTSEWKKFENSQNLLQFIRVDLTESSPSIFSSAVDNVLEEPNSLDQNKNYLRQLELVFFKLAHNGHHDSLSCFGVKPTKVELIEFTLDRSHQDDHDGEHDDDHDGHGH